MKKMTARFLSVFVALCLLLTPTVMAEANPSVLTETQKNMASLTVGNFSVSEGEQSISLPVYLTLTGGLDAEGERGLLTLNLSTAEASAANAYVVVENDELKLYLDGMEYGFTAPLDQLSELIETELSAALGDVIEQIPAEMQTAVTDLFSSAMALNAEEELDVDALLSALDVAFEDQGTVEIEILSDSVSAQKSSFSVPSATLAQYMDAFSSLSPSIGQYFDDYMKLINLTLAESGEETTVEEALNMVYLTISGNVYAADTHSLTKLNLSMSVDGETVDFPLSISTVTLDERSAVEVALTMDVDDDSVLVSFQFDDSVQSGVSTSFSMYIVDMKNDEVEEGFDMSFNRFSTPEGSLLVFELMYIESDETSYTGVEYLGDPVEIADNGDETYFGTLNLYAYGDDVQSGISMDVALTLSAMPEGELLVLPSGSINLLEITDEQLEALESDIQLPIMQAAGVLMQDSTIASLLLAME